MKRRHALALLGAVLTMMLDLLAYPFVFSGASTLIQHVFFGPALLGERFLVFSRESWGWPVARGFMTSLSDGWSLTLLFFNSFCYLSLGFIVGLKLGRRLWKKP